MGVEVSSALPQDMLCKSLCLGARASSPLRKQARRLRSQGKAQELLWNCTSNCDKVRISGPLYGTRPGAAGRERKGTHSPPPGPLDASTAFRKS